MSNELNIFKEASNKLWILQGYPIPDMDWEKIEALLYKSDVGSENEALGIAIVNELYEKHVNRT